MINSYDIGDVVTLSAAFVDDHGVAIDPSTVAFELIGPGINQMFTYGIGGQVVKDVIGGYHIDVVATVHGMYYYRWQSTGTGQTAQESQFYVRQSRFL